MKYRHVVVRHTGGPEVLQIAEDELPAPIGGQVLVKILAADVGFSDVNIRRGRYPGGPRPLAAPGQIKNGAFRARARAHRHASWQRQSRRSRRL